MKRKYMTYVVLIIVLAVVNLWRWLPESDDLTVNTGMHGKAFVPEDFRLRLDAGRAVSTRNLFYANVSPPVHLPSHPVRVMAAPSIPAPERSTNEIADANLDRLKLLGVVFRGGKAQAYLTLDKENVIAIAGDMVLGRFVVEKIGVEAVELRDTKNNSHRRIPVSGR